MWRPLSQAACLVGFGAHQNPVCYLSCLVMHFIILQYSCFLADVKLWLCFQQPTSTLANLPLNWGSLRQLICRLFIHILPLTQATAGTFSNSTAAGRFLFGASIPQLQPWDLHNHQTTYCEKIIKECASSRNTKVLRANKGGGEKNTHTSSKTSLDVISCFIPVVIGSLNQ